MAGPDTSQGFYSLETNMMDTKYDMVYSKLQPTTLIGLVFRAEGFEKGRVDIAPTNEFLQCSALEMDEGKTFRPHKHISIEKTTNIAQECWVIMEGSVKVIWYDIDDTVLCEKLLGPGDMAMTFRGGHNYEVLEDETLVYEFKTGPYWGVEKDKEFLDD